MSGKQPSLLQASTFSFVGQQTILLGLLMLSLGIIIGVNVVAIPAAATVTHSGPFSGSLPEYLYHAETITKLAAGGAVGATGGLVFLDWKHA